MSHIVRTSLGILLLLLTSCHGPKEITDDNSCEVHHLILRKTIRPGRFGKPMFSADKKTCPHPKISPAQGCVKPPWPLRRIVTVYWCTRCDSVYKANRKN